MLVVNFMIGVSALIAAGNWLGVGIKKKHANSFVFGITLFIGGIYFLVAAIGNAA